VGVEDLDHCGWSKKKEIAKQWEVLKKLFSQILFIYRWDTNILFYFKLDSYLQYIYFFLVFTTILIWFGG
jgi:hypothetical protein